ncbi:MAG: tetratricopeptide repeat protein [Candidatus Margulisbacteria bacterium]|jgi:tetratricopeptide (TPR) repeat protein|nr:tetratricopeptide repeat protein [Candidatus Margulisiibacteriota bacterium]
MFKKLIAMVTLKFNQKNYAGALEDMRKAIELDPANAEYYFMSGNIKNNLGNYSEAIADIDKALELNPGFAAAYTSRARNKGALGDYAGALADCARAKELLEPTNTQRMAQLYEVTAATKGLMGDDYGALADYTSIIKLDPSNAAAYYHRAVAKSQIKDYSGVLEDVHKALDFIASGRLSQLEVLDCYIIIGQAEHSRGNYPAALRYYDAIIELCRGSAIPVQPNIYINRAETKVMLGDKQGAMEDLLLAEKLGAEDARRRIALLEAGLY